MKHLWSRLILVTIIALTTACVDSTDRQAKEESKDIAMAWSACNSAGDTASGAMFSGKYFFVLQELDNPAIQHGFSMVINYHTPSGEVLQLHEASAVLCTKTTGQMIETCSYSGVSGGKYMIYRMAVTTHLILLAWPSGELIAQDTLEGSSPAACQSVISLTKGSTHDTYYGSLDIETWLRQYWNGE